MKAPPLAKNYHCLTTEERFRLILAATGRRDEAERDRLIRAGGRIALSMPDHAPYAQALNALALHTFIDLLEAAARYQDDFGRWSLTVREGLDEAGEDLEDESETKLDENVGHDQPPSQRYLDLALAFGYVLRAKAEGWKLFCERLNISPFLLWETLPGFDRLQRALALAERIAFVPEGFLRWLNRIRPKGAPELTEVRLTAEAMADANEASFRERIRWLGG